MNQFTGSKEYQNSYPEEIEQEANETEKLGNKGDKEGVNEEDIQEDDWKSKGEKYFMKEKPSLLTLYEKPGQQSPVHSSAGFY